MAGTYPLGANEVYQIGFRLTKRAGLKSVQAADVDGRSYMTQDEVQAKIAKLGLNMESLMSRIASDPWEARYRQLYAYEDSLKTCERSRNTFCISTARSASVSAAARIRWERSGLDGRPIISAPTTSHRGITETSGSSAISST